MKIFGQSFFVAVMVILSTTTTAFAQNFPKAIGYVNDFASVLTDEQEASLNHDLIAFEKKTSIEIAVVTVPWLHGQSIDDYTRRLATEWGVGKRNKNNGVVFLTAPRERKMRIEAASGVSSILTNDASDLIRDNVILPLFKERNMSQGIIDGTHEIMRTLDEDSVPLNEEGETSQLPQAPLNESTEDDYGSLVQPDLNELTQENLNILIYFVGGIAVVVLFGCLIVPPIIRSKARQYVLENKARIASLFVQADELAVHQDVKEETRNEIGNLKGIFLPIDELNPASEGINWHKISYDLDSIESQIVSRIRDMEKDIAFAQEAREKGPDLLNRISGIIEEAENKLGQGKSSERARKHLDEARAKYTQLQGQRIDDSTDWVMLYLLLNHIQSNTVNAALIHTSYNSEPTSQVPDTYQAPDISSWSTPNVSTPEPTPSPGFGAGSGFSDNSTGTTGEW